MCFPLVCSLALAHSEWSEPNERMYLDSVCFENRVRMTSILPKRLDLLCVRWMACTQCVCNYTFRTITHCYHIIRTKTFRWTFPFRWNVFFFFCFFFFSEELCMWVFGRTIWNSRLSPQYTDKANAYTHTHLEVGKFPKWECERFIWWKLSGLTKINLETGLHSHTVACTPEIFLPHSLTYT